MNQSLRNPLLIFILSLAMILSACTRRANDAPDPEKSAAELQQKADNVANRSRQAVEQAEAALQQSAEKIDESLEQAGAAE